MTDDIKDIVVVGAGGGESPGLRGVMKALEDEGHKFRFVMDIDGIGPMRVGLLPPTFDPAIFDLGPVELRNIATSGWSEFTAELRKPKLRWPTASSEAQQQYMGMVCIIAALARVWRRR